MDPFTFDQFVGFLRDFTMLPPTTPISRATRLERDLGITGDDGLELLQEAEAKDALAIPHHVGYKQGWRGVNWSHYRPELTSAGLCEALWARRTYAATGDRLSLEFAINRQLMGSALPATGEREIDVRAEGQDAIAMIELIRNRKVIQRHFPEDHMDAPLPS